MKLGMITYHRALNYGAVLQAFALQKTLNKYLGTYGECWILDYHCQAIEDMSVLLHKDKRIIKDLIKFIPNQKLMRQKKMKFQGFVRKKLRVYPVENNNLSVLEGEFDRFVTGSDQLWNYEVCGDDDSYFLDFVSDPSKRYSYAVSLGKMSAFESHKERVLKNLRDFPLLSLRENFCAEGLASLDTQIRMDIDPTLLLTKNEWDSEIFLPNTNGDYIFLYCVAPPRNLLEVARRLKEQTGLPVLYLTDLFSARFQRDFIPIMGQGPEEFVSLIKHARYVLTTSFHGTVFSLIYHKQFYAEVDNLHGINNRVKNLLHLTGVECCGKEEILQEENAVNEVMWQQVDDKLISLRKKSENYLRMICGGETCETKNDSFDSKATRDE